MNLHLPCLTPHNLFRSNARSRCTRRAKAIINRLAMTLPTTINLDRFLNVIVSELGRMMNVDRCDVIQLTSASELRISHEWRASD